MLCERQESMQKDAERGMHPKHSATPMLPIVTHSLFLLVFIASPWCAAMEQSP